MTIELSTLVYDVRSGLSDLPLDLMSDEQIYLDIKQANVYIGSIIDSNFSDDTFKEEAIVALATYFAYINYTSLNNVDARNISPFAFKKAELLRQIALAYLRKLSSLPINDDLSIDTSIIGSESFCGIVTTSNVWG